MVMGIMGINEASLTKAGKVAVGVRLGGGGR